MGKKKVAPWARLQSQRAATTVQESPVEPRASVGAATSHAINRQEFKLTLGYVPCTVSNCILEDEHAGLCLIDLSAPRHRRDRQPPGGTTYSGSLASDCQRDVGAWVGALPLLAGTPMARLPASKRPQAATARGGADKVENSSGSGKVENQVKARPGNGKVGKQWVMLNDEPNGKTQPSKAFPPKVQTQSSPLLAGTARKHVDGSATAPSVAARPATGARARNDGHADSMGHGHDGSGVEGGGCGRNVTADGMGREHGGSRGGGGGCSRDVTAGGPGSGHGGSGGGGGGCGRDVIDEEMPLPESLRACSSAVEADGTALRAMDGAERLRACSSAAGADGTELGAMNGAERQGSAPLEGEDSSVAFLTAYERCADDTLSGTVFGKAGVPDGSHITTSAVLHSQGLSMYAMTVSGEAYLLGSEARRSSRANKQSRPSPLDGSSAAIAPICVEGVATARFAVGGADLGGEVAGALIANSFTHLDENALHLKNSYASARRAVLFMRGVVVAAGIVEAHLTCLQVQQNTSY